MSRRNRPYFRQDAGDKIGVYSIPLSDREWEVLMRPPSGLVDWTKLKGMHAGLAWHRGESGLSFYGLGVTPETSLAKVPQGVPSISVHLGEPDPGTLVVRWLYGLGVGINRANEMAAEVGKSIDPQYEW